jgi:hypothetical protein
MRNDINEYNIKIMLFHSTVKPVYNELSYNEFPVITKRIVFTDSIDFFKN